MLAIDEIFFFCTVLHKNLNEQSTKFLPDGAILHSFVGLKYCFAATRLQCLLQHRAELIVKSELRTYHYTRDSMNTPLYTVRKKGNIQQPTFLKNLQVIYLQVRMSMFQTDVVYEHEKE